MAEKTDSGGVLEVIAEIAPPEIAKRWLINGKAGGSCIASTAVGLLVVKHFGIEAEPICLDAVMGNQEFAEWSKAGCPDFGSEEAAEASQVRYVIIDRDDKLKMDGYNGHLVVGMKESNQVLDLSLGQFRRVEKRINPPDGVLLTTSDEFWTGSVCSYAMPGGGMYCIQMQESPKDWTKAPDWWKYRLDHLEVAKKIIRKVTRETRDHGTTH